MLREIDEYYRRCTPDIAGVLYNVGLNTLSRRKSGSVRILGDGLQSLRELHELDVRLYHVGFGKSLIRALVAPHYLMVQFPETNAFGSFLLQSVPVWP